MTSPVDTSHRHGLEPIAGSGNHGQSSVDVILVHGTRGHPVKSYTHTQTGFFWPEEFLSAKEGRIRMLTWGWDSSIIRRSSLGATAKLDDLARGLLADIDGYGHGLGSRPLVFIAKDIGGIILEAAITEAIEHDHLRYANIVSHIRALMFLGTPHRGSEGVQQSRSLFRPWFGILSHAFVGDDLKYGSDYLQRLSRHVRQIIKKHQIRVCSCWATKAKAKWGIRFIVKEGSASLFCDGERLLPLDVDHTGLVKFTDKHDVTYLRLMTVLDEWISDLSHVPVAELEAKAIGQSELGSATCGQDFTPHALQQESLPRPETAELDGAQHLECPVQSVSVRLHETDATGMESEKLRHEILSQFDPSTSLEQQSSPPLRSPSSAHSWTDASTVIDVQTPPSKWKVASPDYTAPRTSIELFTPGGWQTTDTLLDLDASENMVSLDYATRTGLVAPLETFHYIWIRFRIGLHKREDYRRFLVVPHLRESLVIAGYARSPDCDSGYESSPMSTASHSVFNGGVTPMSASPNRGVFYDFPRPTTTDASGTDAQTLRTKSPLLAPRLAGLQHASSGHSQTWRMGGFDDTLLSPSRNPESLHGSVGGRPVSTSGLLSVPHGPVPIFKAAQSAMTELSKAVDSNPSSGGSNDALSNGLAAGSLGIAAGSTAFTAFTTWQQFQHDRMVHEYNLLKDKNEEAYRKHADEENRALQRQMHEETMARNAPDGRPPQGPSGGGQSRRPSSRPKLTIVPPTDVQNVVQAVAEMPSVPADSPRLMPKEGMTQVDEGRKFHRGTSTASAIMTDGLTAMLDVDDNRDDHDGNDDDDDEGVSTGSPRSPTKPSPRLSVDSISTNHSTKAKEEATRIVSSQQTSPTEGQNDTETSATWMEGDSSHATAVETASPQTLDRPLHIKSDIHEDAQLRRARFQQEDVEAIELADLNMLGAWARAGPLTLQERLAIQDAHDDGKSVDSDVLRSVGGHNVHDRDVEDSDAEVGSEDDL